MNRLLLRRITWVALSVGATALVVLIAANLSLGDKAIDHEVPHLYPAAAPEFARSMNVMLGPGLVVGNRAQTLVNGDEIFPAMLAAIRAARKSITLETYIYWEGKVGQEFTQALTERARAGVKVHFMYDALGSGKIDKNYVEDMKAAGVEVARYNPPKWNNLARQNNRTHRKLLVIDGRIGFTGGVGIADEWSGHAQDQDHWRDTHYRIEGPAAAQMQAAFMENWIETTGHVLHGEDYFPKIEPSGPHVAQVFVSSPGGGGESMQLMYLMSIAAAVKSIEISASYFVPDEVEIGTLVAAVKRGVRLRIIVPGPVIDNKVVRRASRAAWGDLLRAGAEIYEYQPTMFHVKVMVVDGLWTSVGSTNFDNRSFSTNDEANLNVLDAGFAAGQAKVFADDLRRSRRITLEEWQNRPVMEKLWERTMGLLSSQL
ncbi:MAG TPA: cardiolipin synthase [Phenylobacterium sp.]